MEQILPTFYLATGASCRLRMNLHSAPREGDSDWKDVMGEDERCELTKEQPNENVLLIRRQIGKKPRKKKRKKVVFGRRDLNGW